MKFSIRNSTILILTIVSCMLCLFVFQYYSNQEKKIDPSKSENVLVFKIPKNDRFAETAKHADIKVLGLDQKHIPTIIQMGKIPSNFNDLTFTLNKNSILKTGDMFKINVEFRQAVYFYLILLDDKLDVIFDTKGKAPSGYSLSLPDTMHWFGLDSEDNLPETQSNNNFSQKKIILVTATHEIDDFEAKIKALQEKTTKKIKSIFPSATLGEFIIKYERNKKQTRRETDKNLKEYTSNNSILLIDNGTTIHVDRSWYEDGNVVIDSEDRLQLIEPEKIINAYFKYNECLKKFKTINGIEEDYAVINQLQDALGQKAQEISDYHGLGFIRSTAMELFEIETYFHVISAAIFSDQCKGIIFWL